MKKPAKSEPKRKAKRESEPDVNQLAQNLVRMSTEQKGPVRVGIHPPLQDEISRVMTEMGRRGGKIGGKRRAQGMTAEERSNAAALAARERWKKAKDA